MFLDKKIIIVFLISCIPLVQYLFGKVYFFGDALIAFIYIFGFACVITFGFNLTQKPTVETLGYIDIDCFVFYELTQKPTVETVGYNKVVPMGLRKN